MKRSTSILLTLLLVSAFQPCAARSASTEDQTAAIAPIEIATEEGTEAVFCSARAYCEETGTWISCSGYHICTGVDQDCSIGEQGLVFCKGGEILQCPPCPAENAE